MNPKKPNGYWQKKENVLEAARDCASRSEFISKYSGAYLNAKKYGWIDECYEFYESKQFRTGHWEVKENVLKAAIECRTRSEFIKRFHGAYEGALRNGWLEECQEHMVTPEKELKWTIDRLKDAVAECKTLTEFRTRYQSAYTTACFRGVLEELFQDKNDEFRRKKINRYWTKERIKKEALKYQTRKEFAKGSSGAHGAAQRESWLNDVCSHMDVVGHRYKRAIYFIKAKRKKLGYVGLSMNPQQRYQQHLKNHRKEMTSLLRNEHEFVVIEDYLEVEQAVVREQYWIDHYRGLGWELVNAKLGGGIGGDHVKWTMEAVFDEAQKFDTRTAMQHAKGGAYNAALKHGWLDEAFNDHENAGYSSMQVREGHWNEETLRKEANKYRYRDEFAKQSSGAHDAALNMGILDQLFEEHRNNGYKNRGYDFIDYEHCDDLVKQCNTRSAFKKLDAAAYTKARQQQWLDRLFKDHKFKGYTSEKMMRRHQK